jgi:Uma2 family endonuclease
MAEALPRIEHDPTVYPVSDDMGTSSFEMLLRLLLLPLTRRWLAHQGRPCFVGADQFIYWERFHPSKSVAPDLYTCPALPPEACPDALLLWMMDDHAVPPFALEVVSENKEKDYVAAPRKYEELGTKELVIYDPRFEHREGGWRWQVYRRKKRGGWKRPEVSNEDRVRSEELGCWLRVVDVQGEPLLRLGVGEVGDELFPTEEEEAQVAREHAEHTATQERAARKEAERLVTEERAAKEAERTAKEAERTAKETAERVAQEAEQRLLSQTREAVMDVCELLEIEMNEGRRAHLAALDMEGLQALRLRLKSERRWPAWGSDGDKLTEFGILTQLGGYFLPSEDRPGTGASSSGAAPPPKRMRSTNNLAHPPVQSVGGVALRAPPPRSSRCGIRRASRCLLSSGRGSGRRPSWAR